MADTDNPSDVYTLLKFHMYLAKMSVLDTILGKQCYRGYKINRLSNRQKITDINIVKMWLIDQFLINWCITSSPYT